MLIQEYDPQWNLDFSSISNILTKHLKSSIIGIEHIGSTAVPGLAAKPIIDIDVIIQDVAHFEKVKDSLISLGYLYAGNQGIVDREVFKRSKSFDPHPVLDHIAHHLYVCPANSVEWRRHLAFRNALVSNEAFKKAYQSLKIEIAHAAAQDKKRYAQMKEVRAKQFIEDIINRS